MTWGEFKKAIEAKGVTDDMVVDYIDFDVIDGDSMQVTIIDDEPKEVGVRNN